MTESNQPQDERTLPVHCPGCGTAVVPDANGRMPSHTIGVNAPCDLAGQTVKSATEVIRVRCERASPHAARDSTLRRCPFCGGDAHPGTVKYSAKMIREQKWDTDTFHFVSCAWCGVSNKGLMGFRSVELAADQWNGVEVEGARWPAIRMQITVDAATKPLHAEIERLRAALTEIASTGTTTFGSPDGYKGVADAVAQELHRVRLLAYAALHGEAVRPGNQT